MSLFATSRLLLVVLAAALAFSSTAARGQKTPKSAPARILSDASLGSDGIARAIDDPSSGIRWLLVRNNHRPGGPGTLFVALSGERVAPGSIPIPSLFSLVPVIRAGDAVLLEEHTAAIDTCLEAIALAPARPGAVLRVRLKLGGRTVRALAAGPGRVTLAPDTEVWP